MFYIVTQGGSAYGPFASAEDAERRAAELFVEPGAQAQIVLRVAVFERGLERGAAGTYTVSRF